MLTWPRVLVNLALMPIKGSPSRRQNSELTTPQAKALGAIEALSSSRGFPPTLAELGKALGVSRATARGFLVILERKGHIHREPGSFRAIKVVERAA